MRIAQVLLTEDDFMERRRSSNLRHAMEKLLKLGGAAAAKELAGVEPLNAAPRLPSI